MFETAVSLKPDYAEAHKNLGITLKDLGKLDAAIKKMRESIEELNKDEYSIINSHLKTLAT